jgi:hypothetical protein
MPVLSTLGAAIANVYGFTSGLIKDQYFNLVSLLLPGNGTNGKQNNAFLDSSGQNGGAGWTITPNGNATQGTFSPFSQTGWGAYFDGSNDYVSTPDSSAFDLAAVDWTIESWVYLNSLPSSTARYTILGQWNSGTNQLSYIAQVYNNSGTMQLEFVYTANGSTATSVQVNATAVVANSWIHIAFVRDGSRLKFFVNGSEVTTSSNTISATIYNSSGNIEIGRNSSAATNYINGYLSNLRLVKGTAVYTSNFTPSTTPLTAITNTSLLTFQSNRFVDNAATPNTLTPNNGAAITPFSPFAPTAKYETATVGGSGYFDGTGDYLTAAGNAAFDFGSGDFTVEVWIYVNSFASNFNITGNWAASPNRGWFLYFDTALGIAMAFSTTGSNAIDVSSSYTPPANSWNHIAVVRSGSNLYIYVNGVQRGSTYNISTSSIYGNTQTLYIGDRGSNLGTPITGYISNLRIVKGTAITPPSGGPTSLLTAVSGTSLLLNFTNAGITDATAKNVLETVGDAQISTSVSKFGGGSISFDGTSNTGLKAPAGNLFTFGSGAFTVEFWVRFNSVAADQAVLNVTGTTNVLTFYVLSTGSLNYYLSSNGSTYDIASGVSVGSISTGQWYRVALVRSGNTFTPYLNTTAGTTSTSSSALATPSSGTFLHLGMSTAGTSNFNGYIDDVRVTRGVARDMTVLPSAPFPVQ